MSETNAGLRTSGGWVSALGAHVGLEVPDLEEGLRFYRDLLGFEAAHPISVGGAFLESLSGIPGAENRSVWLQVPGGCQIELQQYTPQGTVGDTRVNNQGLTHLSFAVEDVDAEYERLVAAGVRFAAPPVAMDLGDHPLDGHTVAYFSDPWGLALELLGPTPGRSPDPRSVERRID